MAEDDLVTTNRFHPTNHPHQLDPVSYFSDSSISALKQQQQQQNLNKLAQQQQHAVETNNNHSPPTVKTQVSLSSSLHEEAYDTTEEEEEEEEHDDDDDEFFTYSNDTDDNEELHQQFTNHNMTNSHIISNPTITTTTTTDNIHHQNEEEDEEFYSNNDSSFIDESQDYDDNDKSDDDDDDESFKLSSVQSLNIYSSNQLRHSEAQVEVNDPLLEDFMIPAAAAASVDLSNHRMNDEYFDHKKSEDEQEEEEEEDEGTHVHHEESIMEQNVDDELVLLDIDPNELALSSTPQLNQERNKYFLSLFNVPPTEKVVEEVYCAYYRRMPNQGRMYISQNYVCFTSNIFGYKTNLAIPFSSILLLEKKYTAIVVPNAIEFVCKDGQVHFFGSFVFRDQTFKILEALWSLHNEKQLERREMIKDGNVSIDTMQDTFTDPLRNSDDEAEEEEEDNDDEESESEETEDGEDDDDDSDTQLEEVETEIVEKVEPQDLNDESKDEETEVVVLKDTEDLTTDTTANEEESELETEVETDSELVSTSSVVSPSEYSKETLSEAPRKLHVDTNHVPHENTLYPSESGRREHPLMGTTPRSAPKGMTFSNKSSGEENVTVSANGSASKNNTSGESSKGNSKDRKKQSNGSGGDAGGDEDGEDDEGKKPKSSHAEDEPEEGSQSEEPEEDVPGNQHNYEPSDILDLNAVPTSDTFPAKDKFKPKDIVNETLPCSAKDFFFLITADGSPFEQQHHVTRGDTDFQVSSWLDSSDGIGKTRDISFMSPVSNPIGPKITRIKMVQRLTLAKDSHGFVIQSNMHSLDVPYADCFRIIIYIYVKDGAEPNTCSVRIELGVMFIKSTLLRWKIEDSAFKETSSSYCLWYEQAKAAVLDAKGKGQLLSQAKREKKKSSSSKANRKPSSKSSKKAATATKKDRKKSSSAAIHVTPRASATPTIQQVLPPSFTATSTASATTSIEEATLSSLLADALGFMMSIPDKLVGSVNIPVWIITCLCILCVFIVVPRQNRIIRSLEELQNNVRAYKLQTTLFELELNNILFNMSVSTDKSSKAKIRHREDFEQQLQEWYKHKSDIYKHSIDNEVLHQILYQIETSKQEQKQKDRRTAHEESTGMKAQNRAPFEPLSTADLFTYQQQVASSTNSLLRILTWSIIGFLGLVSVAVAVKLLLK